jgi:hypothetical protein
MVYTDFLAPEHGYVLLASTGAFVIHMWLSFKVGQARKKYNVKYPDLYSEKEQNFNCIQRAHQNTLEGIPFYLSLLLAGGIRHPCVRTLKIKSFLRVMKTTDKCCNHHGHHGPAKISARLYKPAIFNLKYNFVS